MSKICVLGLGYIGLPTALLFANNGHEVVGIDVNKRVVETLNITDKHLLLTNEDSSLIQAGN